MEKLHAAAVRNPGMRGLIVRKTHTSLTGTTLVIFREQVLHEALEVGAVEFYGGSAVEAASFRYTNRSVITVCGMDKPSRILSAEFDMIVVDEAVELEEPDWLTLTSRIRRGTMKLQQIIGCTNPSYPTHWLKQRADKGMCTLITSVHEDNPRFFTNNEWTEQGTAYMQRLDRLTGTTYQRLRLGLWTAAEGVIYEEWNPAVHLIDKFDIPEDWVRYWAIDFGYNNPFVCQQWAEDPDRNLYLYREFYESGRLVDEIAQEIAKKSKNDPDPRAILCDHDAEGRAVLTRELGLSTRAANKKVLDGIQAVQERLRDGRIFIMKNCLVSRDDKLVDSGKPWCTEQEMPGYIWDVGAGQKTKETPRKENDHGMDCMRYLVAHRDITGRTKVRWM